MSTKDEKEIVLEVSGITDIKYEEPEEFGKSVLYKAYDKAASITKEIIKDNERFQMSSQEARGGTDLRNSEQIYNIIFFTGDRGTGKTSAMLSYMEFLKDYYREYRNTSNLGLESLNFDNKEYMFTGLEYIDASSLDNKEDILGSVLSKMLKKWNDEEKRSSGNRGLRRKENHEFKKRQIRMSFSNVYENLKNLRSEKNLLEKDSDMFMETLEKLSLTWNLKQSFQELIWDYLDIMEYRGIEKDIKRNNHFLVISIDDLDMNINHGFVLLEQIRKYLMVPNVIVLLSANFEQLEKICNNYYASEFRDIKGDEEIKTYIKSLSREYLEKMVPIQRQVTLLSGKKWEFFNRLKIEVAHCDNRIQSQIGDDDKQSVHDTGTVEEIVRDNFIRYIGAEFVGGGKCLYYLAPDTLREFCVWINQIKKLIALSELKKMEQYPNNDVHELYENSLKWFWNEEFFRLCKKYLSSSEHKIFDTLELLEPIDQIRFLKEKFGKEKFSKSEDVSLLEVLADKKEGTIEEQKLSSISMIYFTIKLAEMITKAHLLNDKEKKEQEIRKLMEYFEDGVWGIWEKKMIRPLMKGPGDDILFVRIGYTNFKRDNKCLEIDLRGNLSFENVESVCGFVEHNKDLLQNYQYMLLFYRLMFIIETENKEEEKNIWKLKGKRLQLTNTYSGIFCFSNFILNIYEGAKLVEKFLEELPDLLYKGGYIEEKDMVISAIKKISIINKLEDWDSEWKERPLLPISNIEYLINAGKRIQEQLGSGLIEILDDKTGTAIIVSKARSFFRILQESLEEYDKEEAKIFAECPFIERIWDEKVKFLEMVAQGVKCHQIPYTPSQEEKEWSIV